MVTLMFYAPRGFQKPTFFLAFSLYISTYTRICKDIQRSKSFLIQQRKHFQTHIQFLPIDQSCYINS